MREGGITISDAGVRLALRAAARKEQAQQPVDPPLGTSQSGAVMHRIDIDAAQLRLTSPVILRPYTGRCHSMTATQLLRQ